MKGTITIHKSNLQEQNRFPLYIEYTTFDDKYKCLNCSNDTFKIIDPLSRTSFHCTNCKSRTFNPLSVIRRIQIDRESLCLEALKNNLPDGDQKKSILKLLAYQRIAKH